MKSWFSSGYTLVEMMIVLFALSVMLAIGAFSLKSFHENAKAQSFLKLFENDLYFTQQKAMATGQFVSLVFGHDHSYSIRAGTGTVYKKVFYPSHITAVAGTMPLRVVYNQNGNISQAGAFTIRTQKKRFRFVFQIGKGRFYVDEQ